MKSEFCQWLTDLSAIAQADGIIVEAQHFDALDLFFKQSLTPEDAYKRYVDFRERWLTLTGLLGVPVTDRPSGWYRVELLGGGKYEFMRWGCGAWFRCGFSGCFKDKDFYAIHEFIYAT